MQTNSLKTTEKNNGNAMLWWSFAGTLLTFLFCTHFLVLLSFLAGVAVSPFVAPAALILTLAGFDAAHRRAGLGLSQRIAIPTTVLIVVGISMVLASRFYDMSWDGLWYHQTAVYQMAHGWNPLYDPMHAFTPHLQDWVRHYAKGPWYVAVALYATTGNIEIAKAAPWIALVAAFTAVCAALVELGYRKHYAVLSALLIAANPVTLFELPSYLVDGLMVSYLAVFVAAMVVWFKRPGALVRWIMAVSAILCINAKFTGLVYLLFACVAGGVYVLLRRREIILRFVVLQSLIVIIAFAFFGFNPYITNTIHRHHPFYPILGTDAFPSQAQQGDDQIEKWETPHNMVGQTRFFRLWYAIFGRPGAQPYYPGENASLMVPFDVTWKDFSIYYFHDVRISGFGPLFSGALILGLIVILIAFGRRVMPREIILIGVTTIVLSLLISPHTWWARYGPQLWWIPVLAVVAGFAVGSGRVLRSMTWVLVALLILNVVPIAAVHFNWELIATRTTNEQLQTLREHKQIEVDFQYFAEPFGERLKNGGVHFVPVQKLPNTSPMELMSVSPGYPCAVRACIVE